MGLLYVPEKATIAELMSQELEVHQKLITKVKGETGDILGMCGRATQKRGQKVLNNLLQYLLVQTESVNNSLSLYVA